MAIKTGMAIKKKKKNVNKNKKKYVRMQLIIHSIAIIEEYATYYTSSFALDLDSLTMFNCLCHRQLNYSKTLQSHIIMLE
jgi:hypothetical protein